MEKLLIINGSPRKNGVCAEVIKQVKTYFDDCEITEYNAYPLKSKCFAF